MSALSTVIFPDVLRSIDSATFTGSYQAVGTPLAFSTRVVKFANMSGVNVTLSWDGVHDHEILPPDSFVLLDVTTNHTTSQVFYIQQGTQFYVKGSSSTGLFYISSYYGR